ncbi:hypothetical protein [Nitrosomonas sp.]|nr:hypothetical protein [Nitrosomonas sp.]
MSKNRGLGLTLTTLAPVLIEAGSRLIDRLIAEPAEREMTNSAGP